jgi:hypothetical protein
VPIVWTHEQTGKKSKYCGSCDDLLIQDLPLPLNRKR